MRVRRSLLFVPGSEEKKLAKARAIPADTLILDLEDAVAPDRKALARQQVAAFLQAERPPGVELAVRLNGLGTPHFLPDLQSILPGRPDALLLPKIDTAEALDTADALILKFEREFGLPPGGLPLMVLVETARGILEAPAIARGSRRLQAVVLGHADLTRDLGLGPQRPVAGILYHARCQLVLAARAAGIDAIDTVFLEVGDMAGLQAEARQAAEMGFTGKLAIHPVQLPPIHEAFTPGADQVTYAERVIRAWDEAVARGSGLFTLDGQMIDIPLVEAQRKILERARRAGLLSPRPPVSPETWETSEGKLTP